MLYPKQRECLDILLKGLQNKKHIAQRHLYLSGEMGSGKTYISCGALNEMHAKKAFVACPATVVGKWKKVYCELTDHDADSVFIYTKGADLRSALKDDKITLIIIDQKKLATAFESMYAGFKKNVLASISSLMRRQAGGRLGEYSDMGLLAEMTQGFDGDVSFMKEVPKFSNIDFLIFDEVHSYKPGHLDFSVLHFMMLHTDAPALFLTGTLFNQNIFNLYLLLCSTNPALMATYHQEIAFHTHVNELANFGFFDVNIWRKIAVKINLEQVKKTDVIRQDIMPLTPLKLTAVQKAWLKVAQENLATFNRYNEKQIDQKTTAYLDLPSREQPAITMTSKGIKDDYQIAMALLPIDPQKTAKFKKLKEILIKAGDEKTIIFVQSPKLIKNLNQLLPNSFILPSKIDKTRRQKYINDQFNKENKQIGIMLPKRVSVGIDIYGVQNIVWYQVPDDVAEILQAQRRIVRMDSESASKVYFLYYGDTYQESIIKQVSQSAVHNAADYNVRDESNLAKATHILFEGLDTNETN